MTPSESLALKDVAFGEAEPWLGVTKPLRPEEKEDHWQ